MQADAGKSAVAIAIVLAVLVLTAKNWALKYYPNPGDPEKHARSLAMQLSRPGAKLFGSMVLESAQVHGRIVEMRYSVKDASEFADMKSEPRWLRIFSSLLCKDQTHIPAFRSGVAVHVVYQGGAGIIETTVDQTVCDSFSRKPAVDAPVLAGMARDITKTLNGTAQVQDEIMKQVMDALVRFDGATAHSGVVEERYRLAPEGAELSMLFKTVRMRSVFLMLSCFQHYDFVEQGGAFHLNILLPDGKPWITEKGKPVLDFTVDRSNC